MAGQCLWRLTAWRNTAAGHPQHTVTANTSQEKGWLPSLRERLSEGDCCQSCRRLRSDTLCQPFFIVSKSSQSCERYTLQPPTNRSSSEPRAENLYCFQVPTCHRLWIKRRAVIVVVLQEDQQLNIYLFILNSMDFIYYLSSYYIHKKQGQCCILNFVFVLSTIVIQCKKTYEKKLKTIK